MHPAYGYMDPYHEAAAFPRPRDHIPHPDHHYPSWEAVPPHVSSRPPSFGPWASNSSFSHSIPTDHNHCCSHSYPPGYYSLRPPHSPVQPPPQYYYHGPYPPYPPYPDFSPSYFVPPPHYSADQYRYDYDKPNGHCCGCPNHVCHPARGSTLKIEEQKPEEEMEQKEGRLIRPQNSPPSPFFWLPHDSNKHKALDGGSELHPSSWNGWIPLDLNNLKGVMQGGGNEKTAEEFPPKFKFIPLKFLENGSHEDKPGVVGDAQPENHLHPEGPGNGMAKAIPVLLDNGNKGQKPGGVAEAGIKKDQVRSKGELEKETKAEAKAKIIPVKEMEEVKMKPALPEKEMKQSESESNGGKKASGSKAVPVKKPSKLPPVCLRVDPLPKKKAVNGNSRSITPPVRKEERAHEGNEEQRPKDTKAREQKKDVKVIKVLDAGNDSSLKPEAVPVVPLKNTVGRVGAELAGKDEERKRDGEILGDLEVEKRSGVGQEEPGEGKMRSSDNKEKEERKGSRSLSQSDAAVLIQSAYRGFEVRRWQPLEKLRKIGRIREQAVDVERQIESLQASSKELDSKRRIVIGEAIMNLLLQLDAIQGLHSTIREIRKAVARYLTSLQEKLDSLGSQATVDEPSQTEQDSTKKRSNDETVNSPSSTLETEQLPEKESADSLEQDGLTRGSSSELRIGTEHDDRKHAETESGNGEAVETPATALELPLPAFSDHEQKEALVVNDEYMESPCTTEESAQSSASRGENMTSIDVAHNLAVQELPELPELNFQESRTAKEICDGAMKDEAMTIKVSDTAVEGDVLDARSVPETSVEKEFDHKDEPLVHPSQLVSETGGIGEDAEEAAVEGEIFDAAIEHESNAGVDQRKSLDSPLEGIKADETDCGDGIEFSAALSEGEDKSKPDIKEHPLLSMEKDDHVNENPAFLGVDNSEGLQVTLLEQIHPLQTMIENVSGEEDGHEGIEYIDAGAAVESSTKETKSPTSNEVPEPPNIAAAFEADYSELKGEDASSAAYNVKTVCSREKQLVEENEKLRQMVENLLDAGKHQLGVISELNGRVTGLEKKLSQKKKVKVGRKKVDRISRKNTGSPAA